MTTLNPCTLPAPQPSNYKETIRRADTLVYGVSTEALLPEELALRTRASTFPSTGLVIKMYFHGGWHSDNCEHQLLDVSVLLIAALPTRTARAL
jgi:hypothetical protein